MPATTTIWTRSWQTHRAEDAGASQCRCASVEVVVDDAPASTTIHCRRAYRRAIGTAALSTSVRSHRHQSGFARSASALPHPESPAITAFSHAAA
jgi:hypothetical protein